MFKTKLNNYYYDAHDSLSIHRESALGHRQLPVIMCQLFSLWPWPTNAHHSIPLQRKCYEAPKLCHDDGIYCLIFFGQHISQMLLELLAQWASASLRQEHQPAERAVLCIDDAFFILQLFSTFMEIECVSPMECPICIRNRVSHTFSQWLQNAPLGTSTKCHHHQLQLGLCTP